MKIDDLGPALCREYLFPFAWHSFNLLHPGTRFVPSRHVMAICHALERVARGETRRLIITVPPRYGKSICTAVALPAWMLGRDPSLKIMVASYGGNLAEKHARDFRTVVTSPMCRAFFPRVKLEAGGNRADEQITTMQGGRKAISLGGAATDFGADLIIVDDLMKAADASSPVERQRVKDFYEQTLLSRLNEKARGRIVVIQQRLHEDDLVGHLLGTGQFEHLNLPAIATGEQSIPLGFGKVWQRRKDDVLCLERETREDLRRLEIEMGHAAFWAQYQQDPTPPGGNRIRWEWFGTYDEEVERDDYQFIVQSWDTAMTGLPTSDYAVCTTWGYRDKKWHLLDLDRARYDFPDLKRRAAFLAGCWRADHVIVEEAGSGFSLVQQLRHDNRRFGDRFITVSPSQDKQSRVEAQTARLQTRDYLLPASAPWLEDLRRELLGFPNAKYDDQVDSLIQFVAWSAHPRRAQLYNRDPETGRPLSINRPESRYRPATRSAF